jgi:hypothetical protein
MDIGPVWEQICEMDIVLDIEIHYISNMTLETVWLEEKGEGPPRRSAAVKECHRSDSRYFQMLE